MLLQNEFVKANLYIRMVNSISSKVQISSNSFT